MADDPICQAPVGPGETCTELASWIVEGDDLPDGRMLLCQAHNDYDLEHNRSPNPRKGVWEEFENAQTERQHRTEFRPKELSWSDFQGWILQRVSQGQSAEMLLRIAMVSINQRAIAETRWVALEYGRERSAPLWLAEREAEKLVQMLRGLKGVEARKIRQEIERLFDE